MHARTLLSLVAAFAASAVSAWSFSKGGDVPGVTEPLPAVDLPPPADHYWWNTITGETQWEDPNPHLATEEGHRYYLHPDTGETTWDKPAHLAWLTANSDEHGREYYHNTVTKESVWEKPEVLAWKKLAVDGKSEL